MIATDLIMIAARGLAIGATLALSSDPSPSPEPTVGIGEPIVVIDCPEGTVPGWLDEFGNPTSCVGDEPNPGGWTPMPSPSPLPPAESPTPVVAEPTFTG